MIKIKTLSLLEGAKEAEGLTVVIDVFRAFTVECFLTYLGVKEIFPVSEISECLALKAKHPEYYLVGERNGIKLEGFDVGNSPSQIVTGVSLKGKTIVHSTSSGVQGVALAKNATQVITASLVNARAVAKYIIKENPDVVSLVAMGRCGVEETPEDNLCAKYIKSLIEGKDINIHSEIAALKSHPSGAKFFDSSKAANFPLPDFFMCTVPNIFDFVLKIDTTQSPPRVTKISV